MAKRWKKGNDDITTTTTETPAAAPEPTAEKEDSIPLPEAHVDDEEMNDES